MMRPMTDAARSLPLPRRTARTLPTLSRRREMPSAAAMARRRFAIAAAKRLLPAAALLLLGVVLFWPEIDGSPDQGRLAFRREAQPRPEALRVVEPVYRGIDEAGRPYTVSAGVAQQPGAAEVLDLAAPVADMVMTDGHWVHLRAETGRYDRPAARLDLAGAVTLHHDDGTRLETPAAQVLLDEGTAQGDAPVAAQGPFGTLTAEGFRVLERGAVIVFTGAARAVLEDRP